MEQRLIGNCTLYLGDCMDVLPTLGKVDAVVADPPFGINFKYKSHVDTPEGYGEWIWSVMEECERHCTSRSPFFVWQAMQNLKKFAQWFPRDWRLLIMAKNFVQLRPTAIQYSCDPVVVWWTEGEQKPYSLGTNSRDVVRVNTASVVANKKNIEKKHPCPRSLDAVSHVIEQWVRPESTVIDPFMGSGTTGVACVNLGRKFIGIEKEPEYFDIACKRIQDAVNQPTLFSETATKQGQIDLAGDETIACRGD